MATGTTDIAAADAGGTLETRGIEPVPVTDGTAAPESCSGSGSPRTSPSSAFRSGRPWSRPDSPSGRP